MVVVLFSNYSTELFPSLPLISFFVIGINREKIFHLVHIFSQQYALKLLYISYVAELK